MSIRSCAMLGPTLGISSSSERSRFATLAMAALAAMACLEMRVFDKLNQHIKDACARHKWTLIDVSKRSIGHGICECDEPYFNFPESKSCDIQGDPYGVVHPNYVGTMKIYYQPIYDAVEKAVNEITNKE